MFFTTEYELHFGLRSHKTNKSLPFLFSSTQSLPPPLFILYFLFWPFHPYLLSLYISSHLLRKTPTSSTLLSCLFTQPSILFSLIVYSSTQPRNNAHSFSFYTTNSNISHQHPSLSHYVPIYSSIKIAAEISNKSYYTINWIHRKPVLSVTQEVNSDGTADVFRKDHPFAPESPASLSVLYQSTLPTLSERLCHSSLFFFKEPPHLTTLNYAFLLYIFLSFSLYIFYSLLNHPYFSLLTLI